MKLILIVLIGFLVASAIIGMQKWKSRLSAYGTLALFAFLQAAIVLLLLFKMKPPPGY